MTERNTAGRFRGGGAVGLAIGLAAYNLLLLAALPLLLAWLLWRMAVKRKSLGRWSQRLGLVPRLPAPTGPRIWLHAVSAGEMAAVKPLLDAAREALPDSQIVISTITPAGMAVARKNCSSADAIFYLPFEVLPCTALALWRLRPNLVVGAEKELWPNLLGLARLSGAAVLTVNGRVSDRMMRRARWLPASIRWLYGLPHHLCVQSRQDLSRLLALGVPPQYVTIAGNTKADGMSAGEGEEKARLLADLGIDPASEWLVAGSTHPGEEEVIVEAFALIRRELPEVRLLVAPRHLERVPEVSALLAQKGLSVVCRSDGEVRDDEAIVVLDTMGELRAAYGLALAGFVGGTIAPIGGHNLLEPVASGRAVLFGPHTESCADVADLVTEAGVGFLVTNAEELAARFVELARDPARQLEVAERGRALIEEQRGAAGRCLEVAQALLKARPG